MCIDTQEITGISPDLLARYVAMREQVDAELKTANSLACMLALLQRCGDDTLAVDPVALGHVNVLISDAVLNVQEMLDDFIFNIEAREQLGQLRNESFQGGE